MGGRLLRSLVWALYGLHAITRRSGKGRNNTSCTGILAFWVEWNVILHDFLGVNIFCKTRTFEFMNRWHVFASCLDLWKFVQKNIWISTDITQICVICNSFYVWKWLSFTIHESFCCKSFWFYSTNSDFLLFLVPISAYCNWRIWLCKWHACCTNLHVKSNVMLIPTLWYM